MVMMVLWGLVSPQLLQKVMALYKADLELLWRQAGWMCLASTRWQGLATTWQSAKPLLERSQKDTSSCKAALCALLPFVPCWPGGKPDVVEFSPPAAAWIDHIYSVQSWLARGLNASYMGAYI